MPSALVRTQKINKSKAWRSPSRPKSRRPSSGEPRRLHVKRQSRVNPFGGDSRPGPLPFLPLGALPRRREEGGRDGKKGEGEQEHLGRPFHSYLLLPLLPYPFTLLPRSVLPYSLPITLPSLPLLLLLPSSLFPPPSLSPSPLLSSSRTEAPRGEEKPPPRIHPDRLQRHMR